MKVILNLKLSKIGKIGDIVDVASGFARNYLIPKKLAFEANSKNISVLNNIKKKKENLEKKTVNSAKNLATKIEATDFVINLKVGKNNKVFGAITNLDIETMLKEKGFLIKKHDILMRDPIRKCGTYKINIKLHPKIIAEINLLVISNN